MSGLAKLMFVPLAAAAVVLATPGPAEAQFLLRPAPPGFNASVSRFMFGGAVFPSPLGGYGFFVQRRYFYTNNFVRPFNVYPPYDPRVIGSYTYSGSMSGGMNTMAVREQYAIRQAQRDARNDVGARQQIFDQWAYERGAKRLDANRLKDAPEGLRDAVLNPSDADVVSGRSLNELLKAVQDLEAKGAKAESPFLPPDVLETVVFAGGPAADALNLVRSGTVEFPTALRGTEYDALRGAIEKDVATAHAQVRNGKKIDLFLIDRIGENARKLKAKAAPAVRGEAAFDDAAAVVGLLNRLEAAAKFLKSAEGSTLFVPGWQSVGVSLTDLSKHMARHKIQFGPVAVGNEAAYTALHRGMVGYLTVLTQAKR